MRRFILDNDGSNLYANLAGDLDEGIAETIADCPGEVTTVMMCSAAGTCYYPTKVGNLVPNIPTLTKAVASGRDPLGEVMRGLRGAGKEVFITLRMNDVHNPTEEWNLPPVRRRHPDAIVGADEVKAGRAEWMSYCMDYERPEVRAYMLALIEEQVARYADVLHGFQLDWMRFPRHLCGKGEEVWARRGALTDFVREVRHILDRRGKRMLLSVRTPVTPEHCRNMGLDVQAWAREKLIDLLVVCPFLTTHWDIPIGAFREWMGAGDGRIGSGPPIYAGLDFHFGRQSHHIESLRGVAASFYNNDADGVYLFNFPCWIEYLAARPYHWLEGLGRPETVRRPMLVAVNHARHRIGGVDPAAPIPCKLAPGASVTLPLLVPALGLPARRAVALVVSRGDVALRINDTPARAVLSEQDTTSPHRPEIFLEFVDQTWDKNGRPGQQDGRVFRVDPGTLRPGNNTLAITNTADRELEIDRVNLGLW